MIAELVVQDGSRLAANKPFLKRIFQTSFCGNGGCDFAGLLYR